MKTLTWLAALATLAITATMFATTASAQATRTWVSGVGDDANPCSRTAPCKTFAGAISKTASGGEINCLDPGGFGALTITKPISISCEAGTAGVLASGTNGITVNLTGGGNVLLLGLDFEGVGAGLSGVKVIGGGKVTIRNCVIRDFTQYGVDLEGTVNARVFVTGSLITANTQGGILISGISGVANSGIIDSTTIDNSGAASVKLGGPSAAFTMSDSVLTGSGIAVDESLGGTVTSYGNSVVRPAATITSPLTRQ